MPERFGTVELPARDYRTYLVEIRYILEWISIHKNDIGAFARFDRTAFSLEVHRFCGNDGRGANGFHRSEPGFHV